MFGVSALLSTLCCCRCLGICFLLLLRIMPKLRESKHQHNCLHAADEPNTRTGMCASVCSRAVHLFTGPAVVVLVAKRIRATVYTRKRSRTNKNISTPALLIHIHSIGVSRVLNLECDASYVTSSSTPPQYSSTHFPFQIKRFAFHCS